ncbi:MAG TPA: hypothetical protein VMU69_05790 [Bradyrhizobium sp.]|nr:hypothetical protein [Bradyrhizobium sp.]
MGWLEIKCSRCETKASIPLNAIRRPRDTPIWYLLGRSGFEAEKLLPGCGEFPHDQHFSEASRRGDIEKIVSVWIQAEIWLAGLIGRHIADAANSAAINNLG